MSVGVVGVVPRRFDEVFAQKLSGNVSKSLKTENKNQDGTNHLYSTSMKHVPRTRTYCLCIPTSYVGLGARHPDIMCVCLQTAGEYQHPNPNYSLENT